MPKPYLPLFFLAAASSLAQTPTTATITVTAAGTAPFTFQWNKDGAPIPGATANPLVLTPLSAANAGVYTVQVSNSAGTTLSTPATLDIATITTSGGTAPADLSKQYAEAGLTGNYDPPVGQWQNGFAVVPIKRTRDPGNHFSDTTGIYTVGTGEAGVYEIRMTLRAVDQPPANVSVGLTAGTNNLDDKTGWGVTPPPSQNYIHWGLEHVNIRTLPDGAQIRCNVFVAAAITIQGFDVVIRRLY